MGMFDYCTGLNDVKCPKCGGKLTDWQSKSSHCMMEEISFKEVDNFYTTCGKCNIWIEYQLRPRYRDQLRIEDYDLFTHKLPTQTKGSVGYKKVSPAKLCKHISKLVEVPNS